MKHELKTDPQVFEASWNGDKPFEIRYDDRSYDVGDELILKETKHTGAEMKDGKPLIYTGRRIYVTVGYVLRGPIYGLENGWVVMTCEDFERHQEGFISKYNVMKKKPDSKTEITCTLRLKGAKRFKRKIKALTRKAKKLRKLLRK